MRPPAPPYRNEGPHALWHVSEDPSIVRFDPRASAGHGLLRREDGSIVPMPAAEVEGEALVWATDTRIGCDRAKGKVSE